MVPLEIGVPQGENKVLQGQTAQHPLVAGFLVGPESAPCLMLWEMVVGGICLVKGNGVGIEAIAGRLQSVLVSEPRCGGKGRLFASRQSTASGNLGGPSSGKSNEVGMVCTQCLPKGSH